MSAGIFTLDAQGRIDEVQASRAVGSGYLIGSKGIIPVSNEMIVVGDSGLFLLVERDISKHRNCLPAVRDEP